MSLASATSLTSSGDAARDPGGSAPDRVPGLRERSKARRRALIQRTAMRLFAERGFEHTTRAEIAEEAEVALRTLTGYFPSKLDLGTSFMDEIGARLTAAFPLTSDADFVEALDRWLTEEEQLFDPELMELANAMWTTNPDLFALGHARLTEATKAVNATLLAHVGLPADHPMFELCTAAVQAVIAAHFMAFTTHMPSAERHGAVIVYVRAIIDTAKPPA
jgi:AcrR family transcriptional regulator